MRNLFLLVAVVFLFSCKKETKQAFVVEQIINIDVRNNEVTLKLSKISYTDSVIFKYSTAQLYDCNLYRLNYSLDRTDTEYNFVLGNIYYATGYCQWGMFPATATYQAKDLVNGNYIINVKKNNQTYTGKLTVTSTSYAFDWAHDAVMKIEPKLVNK